jgi:hypothetical protein
MSSAMFGAPSLAWVAKVAVAAWGTATGLPQPGHVPFLPPYSSWTLRFLSQCGHLQRIMGVSADCLNRGNLEQPKKAIFWDVAIDRKG